MKREFNGEQRNKMRVLQLIDSLRSGGAERMSVSYANAFAKRIDASFLCCSRKEGLLKKQLAPEVGYLFLNKKGTLDLQAFQELRKFVKENKINIIQAHSSSWFLALMVKLSLSGVKLVWHDHYGRDLQQRKVGLLKLASKHFDGIIAVNKDLEVWSRKHLYSKKIRYIRNFLPENSDSGEKVELKGGDSFRMICVANFRPQKDHLNLLKAFLLVLKEYSDISMHLVGREEDTSYYLEVGRFIETNQLQEKVFIYGEVENVGLYLKEAHLGILASKSEGLPLALLEYGLAGLPVICTKVGECMEVLGQEGLLVPPQDSDIMADAIRKYLKSPELLERYSLNFQKIVQSNYTECSVMTQVLQIFSRTELF